MQPTDTPITEFLESLPDGVREDMTALDAELAPVFGADRVLWEGPMWGGTEQRIIGYGRMMQRQRGGDVEWFVVGLAAQKAHLSLYVNAVEDGQYLVRQWAERLGRVKVGSANVTFKRLADVDVRAVVALAERARDLTVGSG
jgi:hypothetical protein